MGILKDDDTMVDGFVYVGDFSTEAEKSPTPSSGNNDKTPKRRKPKNIDRFTMADVSAGCTISSSTGGRTKGKGKRRQHRLENVKYLLSLWDKDDDDQDSITPDEPLETIFTQIVKDDDSRKIWNKFAELSGQEQDEYLAFIEKSEGRRKQWTQMACDSLRPSGNPAFRTDVCDTNISQNKKCNNESAEADYCYQRIERRLRNALNKQHVPLGMLEKLETDLTSFFVKWPSSKYTSELSSSYERLLMHALCQYLGLLSQSVTHNGHRCTQVQTKGDSTFHPPAMTLSQYIKEKL